MVLMAFVSIAYPAVAVNTQGDAGTPAGFVVNYNVASVTTFLVQSASAAVDLAGARNINNVWPTTRNMSDNSWGNVTNQGNVAQTFKASVDLTYTGISLMLSNVPAMTGEITVGTTPAVWPGSSNVAASGKVDIFLQGDFVNAADGAYTQTLTISV